MIVWAIEHFVEILGLLVIGGLLVFAGWLLGRCR